MNKLEEAARRLEGLKQLLSSTELQTAILEVQEKVAEIMELPVAPQIEEVYTLRMLPNELEVRLSGQTVAFERLLDFRPEFSKQEATLLVEAAVMLPIAELGEGDELKVKVTCSLHGPMPDEYTNILRAIGKLQFHSYTNTAEVLMC